MKTADEDAMEAHEVPTGHSSATCGQHVDIRGPLRSRRLLFGTRDPAENLGDSPREFTKFLTVAGGPPGGHSEPLRVARRPEITT